jgi:hypothetical protein
LHSNYQCGFLMQMLENSAIDWRTFERGSEI